VGRAGVDEGGRSVCGMIPVDLAAVLQQQALQLQLICGCRMYAKKSRVESNFNGVFRPLT
jgi:hypothetical protein